MSKKTRKKRGKSLKNLEKGVRFSSEHQPENNGRKKLLKNVIKSIPEDAQAKIYETLFAALHMSSIDEAKDYLEASKNELGEYGFILQTAIKGILAEGGFSIINDILDRLFGRPKQQADINLNGDVKGITINVRDFSKKESDNEEKEMDGDKEPSKAETK